MQPSRDVYLRDSQSDTGKYSRRDEKELRAVLYPNGVPTGGFPGLMVELGKDADAEGPSLRAPVENLPESGLDEEMFSDEYAESESEDDGRMRMRMERSVPEFTESARSGDARSEEQPKNPGLRLDGAGKRSEVRWNRDDDGKLSDSRPDEPKVVSSTFALAGDSAHNHAVVYWSGKNSSVSPQHSISLGCFVI